MRCAHRMNPDSPPLFNLPSQRWPKQGAKYVPVATSGGPHHPCCPAIADFTFDCLLQTDNAMDDPKRERKRKEIAARLTREMGEHRDECVFRCLLSILEPPSIGTL